MPKNQSKTNHLYYFSHKIECLLKIFWTCVAVSISYDDNHYTTATSITDRLISLNYRDVYQWEEFGFL